MCIAKSARRRGRCCVAAVLAACGVHSCVTGFVESTIHGFTRSARQRMSVQRCAQVQSLHRYPVKSCLGEGLSRAEFGSTGILGDRTYVVSSGGRGLTQRENPRLAAVVAQIIDGGNLKLSTSDSSSQLEVAPCSSGDLASSSLFGSSISGIDQGDEAAAWVSSVLQQDGCRLVLRSDSCKRQAAGYHWADIAPLLVISQASFDALSENAGRQIPADRFRANIVVAGSDIPHVEDCWRRIRIGSAEFDAVGPCGRCGLVDVDQQAASRDLPWASVYGALVGYRGQAVFGQYFKLVQRADADADAAAPARVSVGDEIEVIQ